MAYFSNKFLHDQSSEVSVDTIANYKSWGWKAIVMQNDLITLATVPTIGGRVMQYDLGGHSSIFINPDELTKTYTPSKNADWRNFGGYKTWPSPQSRWPNTWPPPPTLDCGNYTSQIDSTKEGSGSVLVASPVEQWVAPGVQFERKATLYIGTSRVKMEQTIINNGTSAVSWGLWSIMQSIVNHPSKTDYENFWVYFPINPNSVYGKSGVQLPDGSSNAWKGEVAPGVYGIQFFPSDKKIYADPHKGWIAYSDLRDGVVYATTFEIFEGAPYPDNARITAYVSGSNPLYLEIEVKAPVVELAAGGGRYTFIENWWAARVRAPMLDINSVGIIAGKLSYNSTTLGLSAIYGVFHKGTARVVCIDALGRILIEGTSIPVSPLEEFQLQEIIDIPDSAKKIEIRIYNIHNALVGILDSSGVPELLTGINAVNSDRPPKF